MSGTCQGRDTMWRVNCVVRPGCLPSRNPPPAGSPKELTKKVTTVTCQPAGPRRTFAHRLHMYCTLPRIALHYLPCLVIDLLSNISHVTYLSGIFTQDKHSHRIQLLAATGR